MYKQVAFALFVSMAFIDFVNGSCRDITLDDCDYGENGPFETKKGIYFVIVASTIWLSLHYAPEIFKM